MDLGLFVFTGSYFSHLFAEKATQNKWQKGHRIKSLIHIIWMFTNLVFIFKAPIFIFMDPIFIFVLYSWTWYSISFCFFKSSYSSWISMNHAMNSMKCNAWSIFAATKSQTNILTSAKHVDYDSISWAIFQIGSLMTICKKKNNTVNIEVNEPSPRFWSLKN